MIEATGRALEFCARHGRWGLVLGLAAGLGLPGLAAAMRPWLPEMVAILLFFTAFRIGYRASAGQVLKAPRVVIEVLALQLVLPLVALGLALLFGLSATIPALAVILMMSAPALSGSPNFAVLLGHDPAPAMQVLVAGTALFPLTSLPILWALSSEFGALDGAFDASLTLIAVILVACALGFAARAVLLPRPTEAQIRRLDGIGVIALAVIVVALMTGIRPLLDQSPLSLLGWLALVFAANFGLQTLTHSLLGRTAPDTRRVSLSIIAGNRNVALFLLALPEPMIDALLPFIGCYQLPMYLTPLLLGRLYRGRRASG